MIQPHGHSLVNCEDFKSQDKIDTSNHFILDTNNRYINDLEMISSGVFSPLEGFMEKDDFNEVILNGRLSNSIPWTIPIILPITEKQKEEAFKKDRILLRYENEIYGEVKINDIYKPDKEKWMEKVYQTLDESHPGVSYVKNLPEYLVGGQVKQYKHIPHNEFKENRYTPRESRQIFQQKGWKSIVGFQTRNPIHRAHEYLLKCALEMSDGLFIHPLVGETKSDDIPAETRMKCYEVLISHYFPKEKTMLGVFPAAMNYAGPKEAIFHAICRKNYGCTHFIVGRDHAGVGNFYGTYDAHHIFDQYSKDEIGIVPIKMEHAFYCNYCGGMASEKTCPKPDEKQNHVFLSGTKVREMLSKGEIPPEEFTRTAVASILTKAYSNRS